MIPLPFSRCGILSALGVLNALDLDQACLGVHSTLAALVAQVATPKVVRVLASHSNSSILSIQNCRMPSVIHDSVWTWRGVVCVWAMDRSAKGSQRLQWVNLLDVY